MQGLSITPRASAPKVTLTSAAAAKVAELIEREDEKDLVLRIGVRAGGCSGFSYEMFFDSTVSDADFIAETDGVKMAVDPDSLEKLNGASVDYRDGLQGAGFHIENPNVSRACGCGNSFS